MVVFWWVGVPGFFEIAWELYGDFWFWFFRVGSFEVCVWCVLAPWLRLVFVELRFLVDFFWFLLVLWFDVVLFYYLEVFVHGP